MIRFCQKQNLESVGRHFSEKSAPGCLKALKIIKSQNVFNEKMGETFI